MYTVGRKREVRTGRVDSEAVDCDESGRPATDREYRRYKRRGVRFVSTIGVLESGQNVYCEDCAVAPRERRELEGGDPADTCSNEHVFEKT